MGTKGVMQQIREHLIEGKSSQEVIALGYAPGSVYKIQRQLRRSSEEKEKSLVRATPEASIPAVDMEALLRMDRLETENAKLRAQMVELRQEVERATSLQHQLAQLQQQFEDLDTKVGQSQQEAIRQDQELAHRIETLERQVQRLDKVVYLLGLLTYHLDVHHRQQIHGWPPNPADRDLQPSDEGYRTLQQQLRQWLTEAMTDVKQRQQFGLPVRLKGLTQNIHPQQFLPRLTYLSRQPKP
jgi:hypothetical protein